MRKYSQKQIDKYKEIAAILEASFVTSKRVIYFDFPKFVQQYKVSPCLQTMLIRLCYIQAVRGKHNWSVLKAHPFQSMARNPEEMLKLITDYNTEKKWAAEQRANQVAPPPISEPEIVDTLEVNTDELIDVSESAERKIAMHLSILANKLADERIGIVRKAWRDATEGVRDPILGQPKFPLEDTIKALILPVCLEKVTKAFYDSAIELMVKEVSYGKTS